MKRDTGKPKVLKRPCLRVKMNEDQKNDVFKSQLPVAMTPSDKGKTFHFLFYLLRIKSHQLYDRM